MKAKLKCPIVAITAHVDKSVQQKALSVGMKAVINKPLFLDGLRKVLEEHYSK